MRPRSPARSTFPTTPATATDQRSLAAAVQNGYTNRRSRRRRSTPSPRTQPNHQQMDVTITAPIPTFFMRVFGIN